MIARSEVTTGTDVDLDDLRRRVADADDAVLKALVATNAALGWRHDAARRLKAARDQVQLVKSMLARGHVAG